MSCIVLEHYKTREMRFMRVDVPENKEEDERNNIRLKLKFFQLGIIVNKPKL